MNQEEALAYVKSLGYAPLRILPLEDAKHIFSHVEWHMKGYAVLVEEPGQKEDHNNFLFVEREDAMERYAIPSAFVKYAEYLNIEIGKNAITVK